MNRLKHTLLALPEKTETFGPIYEGTLRVRPAECFGKDCTGCRSDPCHVFTDDEPTYYHDGVGYTLSATHKLAKDRPTVVIERQTIVKLHLTWQTLMISLIE